jgi:hypothetical protein
MLSEGSNSPVKGLMPSAKDRIICRALIISIRNLLADIKKNPHFIMKWGCNLSGGDKRDRTADLLNAMEERVYKYEYLCTKWSKQSIILR